MNTLVIKKMFRRGNFLKRELQAVIELFDDVVSHIGGRKVGNKLSQVFCQKNIFKAGVCNFTHNKYFPVSFAILFSIYYTTHVKPNRSSLEWLLTTTKL